MTLFQQSSSVTIRQGGAWCRLASVMEDTHLRFLLICQNGTRAAAPGDCDCGSPVWVSEVLMIWLFRSGYQRAGRGESLSMSTIPSVHINQSQAATTLYLNTPVNPIYHHYNAPAKVWTDWRTGVSNILGWHQIFLGILLAYISKEFSLTFVECAILQITGLYICYSSFKPVCKASPSPMLARHCNILNSNWRKFS